jgi:hypothetical protein
MRLGETQVQDFNSIFNIDAKTRFGVFSKEITSYV